MKFEQVLQIYWSKGFLFNGRICPFDISLQNFFRNTGGLGSNFKFQLVRRFELYRMYYNRKTSFKQVNSNLYRPINVLLSQTSTVNNQISELVRLHHVRLYLTKTFRGRAHALGRPSRGQRTWSNAWTAFNTNRVTRQFISSVQKTLKLKKVEEKINYKLLQKKTKKTNSSEPKIKKTQKKDVWF